MDIPNYWGGDRFFHTDKCDRCGEPLSGKIMSWFNNDALCLTCSAEEDEIKERLRRKGFDPADYEGCGYIPRI